MPLYKYMAKDLQAKKITGKLEASDRKALADFLRSKDQFLIRCDDVTKVEEKVYKMKLKELSDFSRQIGTMLGSGVSLIRAMSILVQREEKLKLKAIYSDIYRKLQQGYTLSSSMQEQGKAFPELMISMYRSGESSGQMEKTAMIMANQFDKDNRLRGKVKNASIYPIILLILTVAVVIGMFTFIIPQFADLFKNMELPLITRVMYGFSGAMTSYWYLFLLGFLILIVIITSLLRVEKVRLYVDEKKLHLPIAGKLLKTIYTARFARTLCSLYSSGISIVNAFAILKTTVGNKYIEEQFDKAIVSIRNGTSLSQSIQLIKGFDSKLASSIFIGEESGQLDTMLTSLADDFDYEAEMATQRLVSIMEPLMIVILAVIICLVMIAVLGPVFSLYQDPTKLV